MGMLFSLVVWLFDITQQSISSPAVLTLTALKGLPQGSCSRLSGAVHGVTDSDLISSTLHMIAIALNQVAVMESWRPRVHRAIYAWLHISNCDLHFYAWLDPNRGDLLDHIGWGVKVNEPLVYPQLESVPGVCALSTRRLPCGDM